MAKRDALCPFCGAFSPRSCDLDEEAGYCAWEQLDDEQDPDDARDDAQERQRLIDEDGWAK